MLSVPMVALWEEPSPSSIDNQCSNLEFIAVRKKYMQISGDSMSKIKPTRGFLILIIALFLMVSGYESMTANKATAQTPQDISENIAAALNQTAAEVANQTTLQVLEDVNKTLSQTLNQTATQVATQTAAQVLQNVNQSANQTATRVAKQAGANAGANAGADAGKRAASEILPQSIQNMLLLVFLIIAIPLILNLIFRYVRRKSDNNKQGSGLVNVRGENSDFYRALMTFGLILIVGLLVFYLIAIISANITTTNNVTATNATSQKSNNLDAIINVVQNLAAILGTALASVIAFYFGLRASAGGTPTTGGTPT